MTKVESLIQELLAAGGTIRLQGLEVRCRFPDGRDDLRQRAKAIREELRDHLLVEEAKRLFETTKVWTVKEAYYYAKHPGPSNRIVARPSTHPGGTEAQWRKIAGQVICGQHDGSTASELRSIEIGLAPFKGGLMDEARARIKRLLKEAKTRKDTKEGGRQTR